ncbi:putative DUF2993 family protein [Corynebacterium mustelae]|uniref:Putative DUF2993 family protein n=1 Tax=Corynebacterium mustelae TaxID=571915 RepID=A0A0G3H4W8_9CORY|nr:DUF2993 domain-containing protein [Corynebacterium mustelae]AKK06878.1 putative DUF2993 family protein [Corynebacterium mustelae]
MITESTHFLLFDAACSNYGGVSVKKRRIKRIVVTLSVIAGLLASTWVVDTAVAARSEKQLSDRVESIAELAAAPEVYLGGFPFSAALLTGTLPDMYVSMTDVAVEPFGLIRAHTSLTDVEVTKEQVLAGDIDGSKAALISRGVALDAVALGSQLGISDLDISHPYDISPAGGHVAEVQLSGTPPDLPGPVVVLAELRLVGKMFHLNPVRLVDRGAVSESGSDGLTEAQILDAFRWELNTRTLPLARQASYVASSGGTIYFESQERNVVVHTEDLIPKASDSKTPN